MKLRRLFRLALRLVELHQPLAGFGQADFPSGWNLVFLVRGQQKRLGVSGALANILCERYTWQDPRGEAFMNFVVQMESTFRAYNDARGDACFETYNGGWEGFP